MYKNRCGDGRLNLCGGRISGLRFDAKPYISQRLLAERLQRLGVDLNKNAISKIELGERFVTDIELKAFAQIFNVTADELLGIERIFMREYRKLPPEQARHILLLLQDMTEGL